jgi:hypothetical protein
MSTAYRQEIDIEVALSGGARHVLDIPEPADYSESDVQRAWDRAEKERSKAPAATQRGGNIVIRLVFRVLRKIVRTFVLPIARRIRAYLVEPMHAELREQIHLTTLDNRDAMRDAFKKSASEIEKMHEETQRAIRQSTAATRAELETALRQLQQRIDALEASSATAMTLTRESAQ